MTATEVLRRLLDERGVEYRFNDATKVFEWHFDGTDGEGSAHATEVNGGVNIIACSLTPEQAIAATLGSSSCTNNCTNGERTGTCTADETETWECVCDQIGRYGKRVTVHVMECSECGHTYEHVNGDYEYCPHCGRRLEVTDG